ncbi:hypothetical protein SAMN04487970_1015101 [Paenibacillus tianmuensis]|uniref:Uncharacterized protein n=1 Tax=Paenibacillus tianmuensis TaxID=624147 RepID=A0A1G4RHD3_9BACL|nr:hypothetical protein [Paenibacillus tianmuensis]SCW56210.1 hypothetical protein SAMN04487970_1015101 [Paenibacillus tianmuensis]
MSSSDKSKAKLPQWDALMLESLKAYGWSKEELLRRIHAGELPQDESEFQFDYKLLTATAASDPAVFEEAVFNGYQIKYSTLRGISSWILLALGEEPELSLEPGQESVSAQLSVEERDRLASTVSYGWVIHGEHQGPAGEKSAYRIEPLHRL